MNSQSQTAQIRAHLESGKSITALDALQLFGCLRLSGRIHELRHDEDLPISSEMVTRNGKRVALYSLQN
ncbi:helix-turn-helix domain-containing protein [uncultured Draconibacterium sp.]|uniref:helix-turn-helix domain-containing protein n=1 Tax=uncultured Draconibacterium sp. TaxID=1573823 RepID=UPI003261ACD8